MDKYSEENMKSYSNCSNAGEINIDLHNLFRSKLCLSPSNDHMNNLKDYWDFAEENKQYFSYENQHDTTQLNDVTSWSELETRRLISSFHQADFTEIQVINKNIKGLNTRTIDRTFKAIMKTKGFKEDLDQEK